MGLRKLNPGGKRSRTGERALDCTPASAAERAFIRAQVLIECTRAVLRAQDQAELGRTLCQLLVQSSVYAAASLAYADDAEPSTSRRRRSEARPDQIRVPLIIDDRAVAVLTLTTSNNRAPDPGELELLQALADDTAYAIRRLREDARRSAIAASERSLRETFEHAGVGITRIDALGRFAEVNQKFCEMLGYSRDELIGRTTREVTVAADYGPGAAFREAALLGRATISTAEKRYIYKNGNHVWVRRTMSPGYDENGIVRDTISVVEDVTERKNAEEAARGERTLLRTIIDAVPHYIYVKDDRGRFTIANKAWLDARALAIEQVQGKTVHDIFPEALAEKIEEQDRPILVTGVPLIDVEQHMQLLAPDGKTRTDRWSATTKVPLRDEAGNIIGVVGISRDITARKRTEKELREYVERFELAARATSDVIWDWDPAANTLWWGEGLEKLFQYRRDQIEPTIESWTSRIHPSECAEIEAGIHRAIDEGATFWSADYRFRRADGSYADVYDRAYIMRDEHGDVIRMLGAMMDISQRKRAEEAMRRERALLRTIIDALPDYIYVKDIRGRYQLANTAWLRARRVQADELPGKSVFDVFPASVAERLHQQDEAVLKHGVSLLEHEQPILLLNDKGGIEAQGWSAATKVAMRDEQGNVVGVVGISRDITARRRMERERAMEHAVARVLSESRAVEETMPRLIRTICEAMGWAYGARWIWDSDQDNLRRAEWWCEVEPDFDDEDRHYWMELGPQQSGGLLRRAWLDGRPTWFSDINQLSFRRKTSCIKFGFRSAYAFPILAHDERIGVMEFFGRDVREPDESLLQVTGAVANQIGQFIRRKRAEESLQESEQQLRAMFENADVGIAVTGLDMRYLRVNDKFCSIVGYDREELLCMVTSDVNLNENVDQMRATRRQIVRDEVASTMVEKQLLRKDRSLVWVSIAVSLVRASDGSPRYFIAVIQDISESKSAAAALKESEEQFRQLAHYDILTQLPNRALFYDRLAHSIAQAKRNKWVLAVLFIDVDRFKHVNDTFGHAAGDQLLKQVSRRLAECVRSDDTVGRLSGDEFAIVLTRLAAAEDAATVAKKIVEVLNTPFQLEGAELFVTASIGITVYPSDSTEQDTLIRNADVAMYRAKERGRNNYQFYTPEMNTRTREMLNMEGELRRALDRDEFVLHFQPKVSLATGRITGVEALLRWRHPERGLVPPGEFIPLLEETGLIVQAGDWVLRAVCRQLNQWKRDGIRPMPVAINLSARQFLAPDLAQSIRQILEENEIAAELLEVEITESSVMTNAEEAIRTLEYLESLGVQTAIDDFGTGYSSLSYLKRFPLRALKVDRSFVRDITTDLDDAAITQAVISMAHSLGLKVVAEGVETEAQLSFLTRYGCDEVQGFLFSRPVPGDECSVLIADDSRIQIVIESSRSMMRDSK
jgi:diguanylate cyclase (GGDEF)-like protein/PAS domain S-box-containing protein